jgi:hypothetical protein
MSISYTNNREYRKAIRDFFEMKCQQIHFDDDDDDDVDEETVDEYTYDADAAERKMNEIYARTKSNSAFCKLYEIAAGHMFSTDLESGLAVLLSYDYFSHFHAFYMLALGDDLSTGDLECTREYNDILKKISK